VLGLLVLLLLSYLACLPALLAAARGLDTPLRIAVAIAAIAPLGLLMGVPFPWGVRTAGGESPPLVAWAWAVNGGASVFGSTLAVVISMTYGFSATLGCALFAYLLAFGILTVLRQPRVGNELVALAAPSGGERAAL
jgi:hypothetical protein